jgi:hypothetical protein
MKIKLAVCFSALCLAAGTLEAAVPLIDAVNTQTAVTLKRGEFDVAVSAYDGGGLLNRNILGVHDNVYLGVAFDAENAIGENNAKFNIPGVLGKVKITDGWQDFPILLAVGYDAFYAGRRGKAQNENPYNRMILGPYFTVTKPIYLFGQEQHLHTGIRTPIQPTYTPEDTELYLVLIFRSGSLYRSLRYNGCFSTATGSKKRCSTSACVFDFFDHLAFEVDFMMGIGQKTNRMIVFEYLDRF